MRYSKTIMTKLINEHCELHDELEDKSRNGLRKKFSHCIQLCFLSVFSSYISKVEIKRSHMASFILITLIMFSFLPQK